MEAQQERSQSITHAAAEWTVKPKGLTLSP